MSQEIEMDGFIADRVDMKSTTETTCGITGDRIDRAQPHLELFGEITASFDSVEEKFSSDTTLISLTMSGELNIKTSPWKDTCDFCSSDNTETVRLLKNMGIKEEDKELMCLCEDCWGVFVEKLKEGIEELRDRFGLYDESGFVITDYNTEREFEDSLTRNKKKSKNIIIVGCDDFGNENLYIDLSNINMLVDLLDDPQMHEMSKLGTVYPCDVCGEASDKGCITTSTEGDHPSFCKTCTENLYTSLKRYVDENESFVMSRLI